MSQSSGKSVRREYIAKIVLTFIFLGGFALFTGWMLTAGPGLDIFELSTVDLVLLSLATYRLGRLIAYDRVMDPFRRFFTDTVPDPTGSGDTVEAKGEGFQQAIGQLICCPICAGTWVAALLTYLLYLFPGPTHLFLVMTAAIGAAELLGAATEALSWTGQHARTMSGAKMREQEQRGHDYSGPNDRISSSLIMEYPERKETHTEDVVKTYQDYRG
jgi:hypothetical protein